MASNLTEPAIHAATRRAAQQRERISLPDPGQTGLQLRITPTGTRTWVLFCRDASGKPRRFPIGQYPAVGLAQARRSASALREQVRQGADPIAAARQRRAKARASGRDTTDTLRALLSLYAAQKGASLRTWSEYRQRIESVFANHLDTALGELRLGVLQMQADRWPSRQSAAAAVRYLRPVLKWACASGRAYAAKELTEITPPATVRRRQRVLSRDELAAILPVLDADGDAYGAAMHLMLWTLARLQEVCGATWGEIDLRAALWALPPARTKSDRPHVIPLPKQAVLFLRALRPEKTDLDALIFTTVNGKSLLSWDRETRRIHKASGTSGWHRHDLRRTGATLLGELGIEPHVVEAALNHEHIGSQLASLYNRARYRPQVADALQLLADALDGIGHGGAVVVPLRHG